MSDQVSLSRTIAEGWYPANNGVDHFFTRDGHSLCKQRQGKALLPGEGQPSGHHCRICQIRAEDRILFLQNTPRIFQSIVVRA
ncbi:MAG: hypothetical protein KGN01_06785 [Patescibacteria group bacterium]|nr:hypothetical protein [Patescibacteria group bacterium]